MNKIFLPLVGLLLITNNALADDDKQCPNIEYSVGFELAVDHYGSVGLSAALSKAKESYEESLRTFKSEAKKAGVVLGRAESDDYSYSTYDNGNITQYDIDYSARFKVQSGGDKLDAFYSALADKGILASASKAIYTHDCED